MKTATAFVTWFTEFDDFVDELATFSNKISQPAVRIEVVSEVAHRLAHGIQTKLVGVRVSVTRIATFEVLICFIPVGRYDTMNERPLHPDDKQRLEKAISAAQSLKESMVSHLLSKANVRIAAGITDTYDSKITLAEWATKDKVIVDE